MFSVDPEAQDGGLPIGAITGGVIGEILWYCFKLCVILHIQTVATNLQVIRLRRFHGWSSSSRK